MSTLSVLITCHNRKEKTLACLRALLANDLPSDFSINILLVDDGSTDGTGESAAILDHRIKVLYGDGHLFWNGGMRRAFDEAAKSHPDFYLWLNDDTILLKDSIMRLIYTYDSLSREYSNKLIIVGATCDDEDDSIQTYGGVKRSGRFFRPMHFTLNELSDKPVRCDTMNGNCVLISAETAALAGNLEPGFCHGLGDFDYGLRACHLGCSVWVTPGLIGTCSRNLLVGNFLDPSLSIKHRIINILSTKGLPPKAWALFTKRYAGPFWFLYWIWPYLKIIILGLFVRKISRYSLATLLKKRN